VADVDRRPDAVVGVDMIGPADEKVIVAQGADAGGDLIGKVVGQVHPGRADRAEVPGVGVVGTLCIVEALDDLRDQEVLIRIALRMGVSAPVHRHAVNEAGEVGAVVEVEAPQLVLIGLALA
jgi:hypothetical protein